MIDFIQEWGMISGFAGLALGTFLFLFREIVRKKIFTTLTKKQSFTILILFMCLVWSISIFSIISYYYYSSSTQLTIFVSDDNGNVVLEHEGVVNFSLGNTSFNETIGDNGRINFSDIPSKYIGDTIILGLSAENWVIVNCQNTFVFNGDQIHLKIERDKSLREIKGIVKSRDGNDFISDALVLINTDTTIVTDKYGLFKVTLPKEMGLKEITDRYLLTISKSGYSTQTIYYSPKSSAAEIRLKKQINEN
jgi:hypothetical protein